MREVKLMAIIQSKIISQGSTENLEKELNAFLKSISANDFISIKYGQSECGTYMGVHYTAIVIFKII
jgi:hypothetical protein